MSCFIIPCTATIQTQSGFALVLCQSVIGHSYTELRSRVFNFVTVISPYLGLMCNLEVLLPPCSWSQVYEGSSLPEDRGRRGWRGKSLLGSGESWYSFVARWLDIDFHNLYFWHIFVMFMFHSNICFFYISIVTTEQYFAPLKLGLGNMTERHITI